MEFDFKMEPGKQLVERNVKKDGKPLVSIVTPFYNAGKYFEQTFYSVLNQSFPWFEWIIVNDGSTKPEDIDLLERLAKRDQRVHVYHKENGGISTARNLAIEKSSTDIIIPLDADDLIEPTYVELLYWALYKHPECDWSYTRNIGFHNQEYLWNEPFDVNRLKTFNFLVYSGAIRKEALEEVGCYDAVTKHYYEDWRTWLKLLAAHKRPVKVGNYGFWYRRLDTGVLSIVNKDPKVNALAKRLIEEVACKADTSIQAKEFPLKEAKESFEAPIKADWKLRVFQLHKKTHVLMLLPWLEMGGADLFNLDICRSIDKDQFEISILTTMSSDNKLRQRFAEHVTDIFALPEFLEEKDYAEFISYFIETREIDVLFLSNSYYGYYIVPWLRKEFPDLAIIDYVHMEEWYWRRGGFARTSGTAGGVIEKTYVCNEHTRRALIDRFGRTPDSVETLYIGVDKDKFDPQKVKAGEARKELGISPERNIVLFPCRIHEQKRPLLMLEIAKAARKRRPDIAFVVVGGGPQFEELKQLAAGGLEETVYLIGEQKDVRRFYMDCDVTLICSIKEGLSLTAYESLSMGKPVITSDVGGQSELIDEHVGRVLPLYQDENTDIQCHVYQQREIDQYVDAICEILSDRERYAQMSRECRKRIELRFSSEIMHNELQSILKKFRYDQELREKRRQVSCRMKEFAKLIDEYYVLYGLWDSKSLECLQIWRELERVRMEGNSGNTLVTELRQYVDELLGAKAYLESQVESQKAGRENAEIAVSQLKCWVTELEKGKAYLENQVFYEKDGRERAEAAIGELKAWIDDLEQGKRYLEKQVHEYQESAREKERIILELKQWADILDEQKAQHLSRIEELEGKLHVLLSDARIRKIIKREKYYI